MSEALLCINIIDCHPLIDGAHRQLAALLVYLDVDTAKHFVGLYLESLLRLIQCVSHFLAHEVQQVPFMSKQTYSYHALIVLSPKAAAKKGFFSF